MGKADKSIDQTTARVLVDQMIDGIQYRCDDLISFDAKSRDNFISSGLIDIDAAAVEYCRITLGKQIIQIDAKK